MPRINKAARLLYLPPVAAAIPFILTAAVTAASLATGTATPAQASLPFLAMSALSISILLLLGVPIGLLVVLENAAISRLIDGGAWARWPQYRDLAGWRAYAERRHREDREAVRFSWLPVIVVTVMLGLAVGVPALSGAFRGASGSTFVLLGAGLGAFYVILVGGVVVSGVLGRAAAEAAYRRRLAAPIPSVYIGPGGLYDEDAGYTAFRGLGTRLVGVEYRDGSPATLNFRLIVHYSTGRQQLPQRMDVTVPVRVLADYREEARALAERFHREGLIRT